MLSTGRCDSGCWTQNRLSAAPWWVSRTGAEGSSWLGLSPSELELGLEPLEGLSRQREVGLGPVEHQVEEQALLLPRFLEQPDQLVLLAQRDQDVLDLVVETQGLHGAHLGPDDLCVASGGHP